LGEEAFGLTLRPIPQAVLGMILLNCIVILILDTFIKMYHDTDTF